MRMLAPVEIFHWRFSKKNWWSFLKPNHMAEPRFFPRIFLLYQKTIPFPLRYFLLISRLHGPLPKMPLWRDLHKRPFPKASRFKRPQPPSFLGLVMSCILTRWILVWEERPPHKKFAARELIFYVMKEEGTDGPNRPQAGTALTAPRWICLLGRGISIPIPRSCGRNGQWAMTNPGFDSPLPLTMSCRFVRSIFFSKRFVRSIIYRWNLQGL